MKIYKKDLKFAIYFFKKLKWCLECKENVKLVCYRFNDIDGLVYKEIDVDPYEDDFIIYFDDEVYLYGYWFENNRKEIAFDINEKCSLKRILSEFEIPIQNISNLKESIFFAKNINDLPLEFLWFIKR